MINRVENRHLLPYATFRELSKKLRHLTTFSCEKSDYIHFTFIPFREERIPPAIFVFFRSKVSHTMSNPIEQGKKLAAYQAVDEYITADHKVVGIGSGSTVVYVVERILQKPELKHIIYVPTSFQSKLLILEGGLTLGSVEQYPEIDVTIDGADEVDEDLNAIKGGGACQFQEKLVAEAAKKFVIVAGKEFIVKGMSIGSN